MWHLKILSFHVCVSYSWYLQVNIKYKTVKIQVFYDLVLKTTILGAVPHLSYMSSCYAELNTAHMYLFLPVMCTLPVHLMLSLYILRNVFTYFIFIESSPGNGHCTWSEAWNLTQWQQQDRVSCGGNCISHWLGQWHC